MRAIESDAGDLAGRLASLEERGVLVRRKDPKAPLSQENKDLAASLQKALEDAFVNLGRDAFERTGLRKFALSGGCALNCNANSRLAAQDFCDDIFIQPASHDGGIALGAALEAMHRVGEEVGEKVRDGYQRAERMVQEYPASSIASVFLGGLVTGVFIGLCMSSKS